MAVEQIDAGLVTKSVNEGLITGGYISSLFRIFGDKVFLANTKKTELSVKFSRIAGQDPQRVSDESARPVRRIRDDASKITFDRFELLSKFGERQVDSFQEDGVLSARVAEAAEDDARQIYAAVDRSLFGDTIFNAGSAGIIHGAAIDLAALANNEAIVRSIMGLRAQVRAATKGRVLPNQLAIGSAFYEALQAKGTDTAVNKLPLESIASQVPDLVIVHDANLDNFNEDGSITSHIIWTMRGGEDKARIYIGYAPEVKQAYIDTSDGSGNLNIRSSMSFGGMLLLIPNAIAEASVQIPAA